MSEESKPFTKLDVLDIISRIPGVTVKVGEAANSDSVKKVQERVRFLRKEITEAYNDYYVKNEPKISDAEFDIMYSELLKLEYDHQWVSDPSSPTQRTPVKPSKRLSPVRHGTPMWSLLTDTNYKSFTRVQDFDKRVRDRLGIDEPITYLTEFKFDGLALSLRYENGILTTAATRGDHFIGEDVTNNAKMIKTVPLKLSCDNPPELIEIRGECLMLKKDFAKAKELEPHERFISARNTASGALRQKDPNVLRKRVLTFIAYGIGAHSNVGWVTQDEVISNLSSFGFMTTGTILGKQLLSDSTDDVDTHIDSVLFRRNDLPFEIDGAVVKVNDLGLQTKLGVSGKDPRYAVAFKFEPKVETTKVIDIKEQVGRTGVVTPVAVLEPVQVGDVTVTSATLHNFDEIERLDIRIGDTVRVWRAGDVIPKIGSVVKAVRAIDSKPYKAPTKCPACAATLIVEEETAAVKCPSPTTCPAQMKYGLVHFFSKNAMNVNGFGEVLAENLVASRKIDGPHTVYELSVHGLMEYGKMGRVNAIKLHQALKESLNTTLPRFLYALGIPNVGLDTARVLANHYGDIISLIGTTYEKLVAIKGVGEVTAKSIVSSFQDTTNHYCITSLWARGMNFERVVISTVDESFKGKRFVLTGKLNRLTREQFKDTVKLRSGDISESVNKQVTHLVVGSDPGKNKLDDAKRFATQIIDENTFFEMMGRLSALTRVETPETHKGE